MINLIFFCKKFIFIIFLVDLKDLMIGLEKKFIFFILYFFFIKDIFKVSEGPIWANAIGIIAGCLLGILIPKMVLSNSST
jgi:hypothetical protein